MKVLKAHPAEKAPLEVDRVQEEAHNRAHRDLNLLRNSARSSALVLLGLRWLTYFFDPCRSFRVLVLQQK